MSVNGLALTWARPYRSQFCYRLTYPTYGVSLIMNADRLSKNVMALMLSERLILICIRADRYGRGDDWYAGLRNFGTKVG